MRDVGIGTALDVARTGGLFALGVHQDNRGVTGHPVARLQLAVLGAQLVSLFGTHREVGKKEDQVVLGVVLERLLRKDLGVKALAPDAPVGPGEIHQNGELLLRRELLGLLEVAVPALGFCSPGDRHADEHSGAPRHAVEPRSTHGAPPPLLWSCHDLQSQRGTWVVRACCIGSLPLLTRTRRAGFSARLGKARRRPLPTPQRAR